MVGGAEGRRGAAGPCRGHAWGSRHVAHLQPHGAAPGEPRLGLEELTAALAALTKSGAVRDSGAGSEGGELQHTNDSGRAGGAPGCAPAGHGRGFPQLLSWTEQRDVLGMGGKGLGGAWRDPVRLRMGLGPAAPGRAGRRNPASERLVMVTVPQHPESTCSSPPALSAPQLRRGNSANWGAGGMGEERAVSIRNIPARGDTCAASRASLGFAASAGLLEGVCGGRSL